MPRLIAFLLLVPALAAAGLLGGAALLAGAERDELAKAEAAERAAAEARERERAVAELERRAVRFAITGRPAQLEAWRRGRARLAGLDPRIAALARRHLDPVVALARRDRRDAHVAITRGGVRAAADRVRDAFAARAEAQAARAAAARERADERAADLRLLALAGGAGVLALALLLGLVAWVAARRARRARAEERRRLEALAALARVVADGGRPDELLRACADALGADRALADALAALAARAAAPPAPAPDDARSASQAPPPGTVDLARLLRESVEAARPGAEQDGVALTLALESVPPCAGDPDRVSLALDQLVERALEAARPGGRVDVRLHARADAAVVELLVDAGRPPQLDLVRSVVAEYGGEVSVDGADATAFRVELPLRVSHAAAGRA